MASYLSFSPVEKKKAELISQFIEDSNNSKFATIYKKHKKNLRVNIYNAAELGSNLYLVMVRGNFDRILVELGRKHGFPRGFPILWSPKKLTRYFGFLPKFSNDIRKQEADNLSNMNIKSVSFFKKWSGFLGQLLVFSFENQNYWTVCSKNSANPDLYFVQEGRKLFEPYITESLVQDMVARKFHICAEMMSHGDQVHGARVLKETPIVTVIGEQVATKSNTAFVSFLSHEEVVKFCVQHNLPCDSATSIHGERDCRAFFHELSKTRDFMNDEKFENLLGSISSSSLSGTVTHREVLGNVLEGVVFKIEFSNGKVETQKYKFPGYTIRTMLLRTEMEGFGDRDRKPFCISHVLKKKARRFVNHWCVSPSGREFWYKKGLEAFLLYSTRGTEGKSLEDGVGVHIQLMDEIGYSEPIFGIESEFDKLATKMTSSTVVIVLGPIGSGKSKMMNMLCSQNALFEPIDGDKLGLGTDITLRLGAERNPYTLWKIIEALMQGKIPVISCGGGVLFDFKGNLILRDSILRTLGISVNIIALCSGDSSDIESVFDFDTSTLPLMYQDAAVVNATVLERVKLGEWKLPEKFKKKGGVQGFAKMIATNSSNNVKFARKVFEESDSSFIFPMVTRQNYDTYSVVLGTVMSSIVFPKDTTTGGVGGVGGEWKGKFMQIRILVELSTGVPNANANNQIIHVTWNFDEKRELEYGFKDLKLQCQNF